MIVGKLGVLAIAVSAPLADARDPARDAGYPAFSVSPIPILREPGHLELPLLAG